MIGRIFTLLTLSCVGVSAQIQLAVGENLPAFPDPAGRAGMAAATVTLEDKSQGILIVGGANFPGRAPPGMVAKKFTTLILCYYVK